MLAIITGTGFYELPFLTDPTSTVADTPYGPVGITSGSWHDTGVVFVARHGADHSVAPHRINYRANIWGLHAIGATAVLATAVSGGINPLMRPGDLVLIDQFIEFTKNRPDTFFDGDVRHTDVSEPYSPLLRTIISDAAAAASIAIHAHGTYVCTNGPRFETPAEIRAYAGMGADLVGMTGYPEVVLANELGLPYASIGVISNPAAGLAAAITLAEIHAVLADARKPLFALIEEVVRRWAVILPRVPPAAQPT